MRKYEALIVFNMKGSATLEELTADMVKVLTEAGATVNGTENLGRREFAYESQHLSHGQYMQFSFDAEPSVIREVRETLAIDERVHYQYYRVK